MKCRECKVEMDLIVVNDDPGEGYAYNVYHCDGCMVLCKEDVWNNRGAPGS